MQIDITVDKSILDETIEDNNKNNITKIDLVHAPFKEFRLICKNNIDYNMILDAIKESQQSKFGKIDIISCNQEALKLYEPLKNRKFYTVYKITDRELFIKSSGDDSHTNKINEQFEVTIKHDDIINLTNGTIESDVNIISNTLIKAVQSLKTIEERNNYTMDLIIDELAVLLAVFTIFQKKATYEFHESDSRSIKDKNKDKKKHKKNKTKNKVTYIKHKTIHINKSINNHSDKTYDRHTDSWVTRGHWRTYKSGKRVWIKEQIKKAKNSSNENSNKVKTYEII